MRRGLIFIITILFVSNAGVVYAVDFSTRCQGNAVLLCSGFDSSQEISNFIYYSGSGTNQTTLDLSIKTSGTGSVRLDIPSNSGQNSSGGLPRIFNESGNGFSQNSDFYVQFRQRFSPEMLGTNATLMGGNGWKQMVLSTTYGWHNDGESLKIGLINRNMSGYPVIYLGDETTFLVQNPSDNIAVGYQANQWMTFYLKVHVGTWGQANSSIEGWIGTETATLKKVFNYNGIVLQNNTGNSLAGFNKIDLTTNNRNKSSLISHQTARTWYDELIISNQPITDPVDLIPTPTPTPTPNPIVLPVYISTYYIPAGVLGSNYSTPINAYGGGDTYNWSISSGQLPPGLSLVTPNCVTVPCRFSTQIIGTPTATGNYTFTVRLESSGVVATRQYRISVNFDTTAPTISNVSVTNVTPYEATINWTTNELANGQVEFCTSYTRCGFNTPLVSDLTLDHAINISGLNPGTTYYYWIKSADVFGNLRTNYTRSFRTVSVPDTTPPIISIVSPQNGSTLTGTVTLVAEATDNVRVSGVLFYRDNNTAISYWEDFWSPYQVSFNTALLDNGPHTFYAVARDSSNNRTTSSTITLNVFNPDLTPPFISSLSVTNITANSATINWTTNEPADSQVELCLSYMRCGNTTTINPNLSLQHSVILANLTPNTYYYFWAKSRDGSGNSREGYRTFRTSPSLNITPTPTPTPNPSVSPTPTPTPTPGGDIIPPIISSVSVTGITTNSAIINWITNELANGQVEFCTSYTRCGNYVNDLGLITSHSINLTNLSAGTLYYTWIKSSDSSGNSRESYRTIRTLR